VHVEIEGLTFTLFADRDRDSLLQLSYDGRITWFKLRFERMLFRPLEILRPTNRGTLLADLQSLLVFGSVLFNGVEALGSFAQTGKKTFAGFIDRLGKDYCGHAEALWDFRNALAHGLVVEHGAFEFFDGPAVRTKNGRLEVDPDALLRDFTAAFQGFMEDLRDADATSPLRKCFESRFEERYEVPPCRA
jgi:hypothetical protein